ncbi:hypothetical protein P3J6_70059 [Pseudoalteromonas sp. 3J6]|nr:hypothetical protein P3J6_70059 [Pseudoalteromonas sp. 3J6]
MRLGNLTKTELHSLSEQQNWQEIIAQTQIWLSIIKTTIAIFYTYVLMSITSKATL